MQQQQQQHYLPRCFFLFITEPSRCLIVLLTADHTSCLIQRTTINQMNAVGLPLVTIMNPCFFIDLIFIPALSPATCSASNTRAHMKSLHRCRCFFFFTVTVLFWRDYGPQFKLMMVKSVDLWASSSKILTNYNLSLMPPMKTTVEGSLNILMFSFKKSNHWEMPVQTHWIYSA